MNPQKSVVSSISFSEIYYGSLYVIESTKVYFTSTRPVDLNKS